MPNLPRYHSSHEQENTSIAKLRSILPNNLFLIRSEDGGDYGVNKILEVINKGEVTNIRSHIQIKSKKKELETDDSLKYPVPINTIDSIFLVYSEIEDIFFFGLDSPNCFKSKPKRY